MIAHVGLGSNLGDRAATLAEAVRRLDRVGLVVAVSTLRETAAVGGPAGSPPFLNGVAAVDTDLPARGVLHHLLAIEAELGRVRAERWGPRTVDLDLLLYGDSVVTTAELTLPHPRLPERRFVLDPLAEIAAEVVHPVLGLTMAELLVVPPVPSPATAGEGSGEGPRPSNGFRKLEDPHPSPLPR